MKNNFKYILIVLAIAMIIGFTGCAKININAEITEDNVVIYSYELSFADIQKGDINYTELQSYLAKIKKHWHEEGFETEITSTEMSVRMVSTIEEKFVTRGKAFAALHEYMTNDISPFSNVKYEYSENYYYEDYSLSASINLDGIVDSDIYTAYPSIVGEDVDEFFDNLEYTVTIILPENESIESNSVSVNKVVQEVHLDAETLISISGRINNNKNVQYEKDINARKAKELKNLIIFSVVGVLSIVGLVVLKKLKKKNKAKDIAKALEDDNQAADEKSNT